MQSIERYGVVALLLLVATVVAVLVWDGGKTENEPDVVAAKETAPRIPTPEPALREPEPGPSTYGPRIVLRAAPQSRPLLREQEPAQAEPYEDDYWDRENPHGPSDPPPAGLVEGESHERPYYEPEPQPIPTEIRPLDPVPQVQRPASGPRYTIRSGDTLSEISLTQLGTSRRWQEIIDLNPGLNPSRLIVGKEILLPAGAQTTAPPPVVAERSTERPARERSAAPATAGTAYRVQSGDSLWKIAARTLGDGERWREIRDLNPKIDPDRLAVGQSLVLPATAASTRPGQQPVVAANAGSETAGRVR